MKIGIITFYNGNINHGGMLQAYALQRTIENLGYDCEQICLDNRVTEKLSFKDKVKLVFKLKFGVFNLIKKKLYDRKINEKLFYIKQRQSKAFLEFQNLIPHTKKIYKAEEINELNDIFDEFVCGSDQVWTPYSGGIRPVPHKWNYYLEFTNKRKISYAASFAISQIACDIKPLNSKWLKKLDAISVREHTGLSVLQSLKVKGVEVVDPVYLLNRMQWLNFAGKDRLIKQKYVLVYDLYMNDERLCIEAKRLSKLYHLTIVSVDGNIKCPYAQKNISNAGPQEFVNLIFHAEYVITNSFHATSFSLILNRPFAVFYNYDNISRISDILNHVGLSHCLNADNPIYNYNWMNINQYLAEMCKKSYQFLVSNLK